jgi:hypothetical protein
METEACRDVVVRVGVVYLMNPPERCKAVEKTVIRIVDKIEEEDREHETSGEGDRLVIQQTEWTIGGPKGYDD